MRALPLLLLLLGGCGVSVQDNSTSPMISTKPGDNKQTVTTATTSAVQSTSPKSSTGNPPSSPSVTLTTTQSSTGSPPSTTAVSPSTAPVSSTSNTPAKPPSTTAVSPSTAPVTSTSKTPAKPPSTTAVSPSTAPVTSPSNTPGKSPSTPAVSPSTTQMTSPTNQLGHPSPTPVTSPSVPQQVSPSASSGPSVAATAATSSAAQQQSSPSASSGNSLTTVATSPSVALGSHPLNQLTSPAASTGVPAATLSPGLKDQNVSSPKSVTQQPRSSTSSAVQKPASSTRPGSINTSVAPSAGSMSPTTSKTSLSLPPGSIDKVSKPTTTLTPGAGQTSLGQGSMSTKPGIADQSPTSVQPSAPTSGHQTTSSRPGHQHPNDTFQNEVICEDQVQNSWPIISLKEAKTCAEWKTLTLNGSLFKTFCSTARYAYDPSRDKCTVTLASPEPRSQRWAVRAVVHLHLDPEKVFEELKEKRDELDKLGITNVTFHDEQLEEEIKDRFSTPLIITIITLAGSLLLVAAIYGCCHQRFSHKKDQQRLTEELQTMENGYHDNPTLEVMETSSEMQEKKVNLNGELGDSWIVPLDTLMKDDLEEEEDTHL